MTHSSKAYFWIAILSLFALPLVAKSKIVLPEAPVTQGTFEIRPTTPDTLKEKLMSNARGPGLNDPWFRRVTLDAPITLQPGDRLVFTLRDVARPTMKVRTIKGADGKDEEHPMLSYATLDWPESELFNFKNQLSFGTGEKLTTLHLNPQRQLTFKPEKFDMLGKHTGLGGAARAWSFTAKSALTLEPQLVMRLTMTLIDVKNTTIGYKLMIIRAAK